MTTNAESSSDRPAKNKRRDLYKISQLATKLNITQRTIRYYEQIGLLPNARRTQGRMRLFDDDDIKRIYEIRQLQKEKDMPLDQIKQFLQDESNLRPQDLAKKRLRIVTDVTAALPEEFFAEHQVERLPISIKVDKHVYGDKHKISNAELFAEVQRKGSFPNTIPPDDKTIQALFRHLSKEGAEQVLVLTISSLLSETYKLVNRQAGKFRDLQVEVLDSRTSAAGLGLLVCEAVRLKDEGLSLSQIKTRIEVLIPQVFQLFTVNSLEHLYKSGRVSPEFSGYMSMLLSFKPIMALREGRGHIELISRADTSEAAQEKLIEIFHRYLEGKPEPRYLAVVYNGLAAQAEILGQTLAKAFPQVNVMVAEGHPVLGVHLGPQAIGLAVLGF